MDKRVDNFWSSFVVSWVSNENSQKNPYNIVDYDYYCGIILFYYQFFKGSYPYVGRTNKFSRNDTYVTNDSWGIGACHLVDCEGWKKYSDKDIMKNLKMPAGNGRFGAMAALAPQQRQCELGSYYPAATLVKPPLRQAAGTLPASSESAAEQ